MQRTMEDLYYGALTPEESLKPNDPEYGECIGYADKLEKELMERLGGKEKDTLEKLMGNLKSIMMVHSRQAFVDGFRIGGMLLIEVFSRG